MAKKSAKTIALYFQNKTQPQMHARYNFNVFFLDLSYPNGSIKGTQCQNPWFSLFHFRCRETKNWNVDLSTGNRFMLLGDRKKSRQRWFRCPLWWTAHIGKCLIQKWTAFQPLDSTAITFFVPSRGELLLRQLIRKWSENETSFKRLKAATINLNC